MAYCDSKQLEADWYNWIVSTGTPLLDPYRNNGLLWTLIIGKTDEGFANPNHTIRCHYLDIGKGVYFKSNAGVINTITINNSEHDNLPLDYSLRSQMQHVGIGKSSMQHVVDQGYFNECPAAVSWHKMLVSVNDICVGISKRFMMQSEEHREDLAREAFLQVTNKLKNKKLNYTPGRAPVFNLLTTTIYRCMYSTLNKSTKAKNNLQKVIDGVASGQIRHNSGSLQCPVPH